MAGGYASNFANCELQGSDRPEFCDDEDIVTTVDRLEGDLIISLAWIYEDDGWRKVKNMKEARQYHQCSLMQKTEKIKDDKGIVIVSNKVQPWLGRLFDKDLVPLFES